MSESEDLIRKIGEVADVHGLLANVGATELAGMIVSCLYANPDLIERFMAEGGELLIDGTISTENGVLTYRAMNGSVMTPAELRASLGKPDA